MNKRTLIIGILGVLLLLFGLLLNMFIGMNKESNEYKNNIQAVNQTFSKFEELIEKFNGERKIYNEEVVNNLYIEEVFENYTDWITIIDDYKASVLEIKEYGSFLKDNCFLDSYVDSNIKSKCESMSNSYEMVINYFVKDIRKFNDILTEYNEKQDESSKVLLYDLQKIELIDFNDDGKYQGYDN